MMRFRLLCLGFVLALPACQRADTAEGHHHIEHLCDTQRMREDYLDFYWDDLRSHQPELWALGLAICAETCPDAVNCGPVLSVASWYEPSPVATGPSTPRSPR